MKSNIVFFIGLMLLLVAIYFTGHNNGKSSIIDEYSNRIDNLTQQRGHSWIVTNGTPDSIYFISFNKDTTWYIKSN